MATGPRPWLITFCITLIYVKRTCPKIVEGTIDTKEVSPLNDKIGVLWNLKLNSRLERARSSDRGVSLIAPFSFEFFQDWSFLTRFCYKDSVGEIIYRFEYPEVSSRWMNCLNVVDQDTTNIVEVLSFEVACCFSLYCECSETCLFMLQLICFFSCSLMLHRIFFFTSTLSGLECTLNLKW